MATTGQRDRQVVDVPEQHRYEIREADGLVGFVQYRRRPGLIAFIHTEIDERREGEGFGSSLIREVLDRARAGGLAVLPFCPFVNEYVRRHPEYTDLVPESYRDEFGL